jgi:hypothetical protein
MSRIKVNVVPKFKTYIIDDVSLEVYKDGRVFKKGKDLSKNKPTKEGYISVHIKYKHYLLHRIVASAWLEDILHDPTIKIDHKKTKSNALSNLRIATDAENGQNRRVNMNSRTGRKNIDVEYVPIRDCWRWRIQIEASGRPPFKKCYRGDNGPVPDILPPVPQFIIDIRNAKLIEYHGAFAHLD